MPSRTTHETSQQRWTGDEAPEHLTFGSVMDAESLWTLYQRHRDFSAADRILEIGPGYGRLLKTALARDVPFASFSGLDLSHARVARLNAELGSDRVAFHQGDVDRWRGGPFDVVICSSTFEHLHPDCTAALRNLRGQVSANATVLIDFVGNIGRRVFGIDPTPIAWLVAGVGIRLRYSYRDGTYIRIYAERELSKIFRESGFRVRAIEPCLIGKGQYGPIRRLVVVAEPS
jgi:2-polyprenyl-3-methyl-5-hydroxy-6-metoxy-1,4-benzoquinol methylase